MGLRLKCITLLAIILAYSINIVCAYEIGENLVPNPSFESGEWQLKKNASIDDTIFLDGSKSAKMVGNAEECYYGTQMISIDPNETYKLVVWIKTENVSAEDGVFVQAQQINASNGNIGMGSRRITATGTQDWKKYEATVTGLNEATAFTRIYIKLAAGETGTVWFDNIHFYKSPFPKTFEIDGDQVLSIPMDGISETAYSALLTDINDVEFTNKILWSTEPQTVYGVEVNDIGVVTVKGEAEPEAKFILVATLEDHPSYKAHKEIRLIFEITQEDIDTIVGFANEYTAENLKVIVETESYRKILLLIGLHLSTYNDLANEEMRNLVIERVIDMRPATGYDEKTFKTTFNESIVLVAVNGYENDEALTQILEDNQEALNIDLGNESVWASLSSKDKLIGRTYVLAQMQEAMPFEDVDTVGKIFVQAVAIASINNATWGEMQDLLTKNAILNSLSWLYYSDFQQMNSASKANVCKSLVGRSFKDIEEIEQAFNQAVIKTKNEENKKTISSVSYSGGGGGGGSITTSITVTSQATNSENKSTQKTESENSVDAEHSTQKADNVSLEKNDEKIIEKNEEVITIFNDIDSTEWAIEAISSLVAKGIVSGMGNGEFKPNLQVTREQFLKMLLSSFDLVDETATSSYINLSDTEKWYHKYLASAERYGIIDTGNNSTFQLDTAITRWEMADFIHRVYKINGQYTMLSDGEVVFKDIAMLSADVQDAITKLHSCGIIKGTGDDLYEPFQNATRAQASVIIYRLLNLQGL